MMRIGRLSRMSRVSRPICRLPNPHIDQSPVCIEAPEHSNVRRERYRNVDVIAQVGAYALATHDTGFSRSLIVEAALCVDRVGPSPLLDERLDFRERTAKWCRFQQMLANRLIGAAAPVRRDPDTDRNHDQRRDHHNHAPREQRPEVSVVLLVDRQVREAQRQRLWSSPGRRRGRP